MGSVGQVGPVFQRARVVLLTAMLAFPAVHPSVGAVPDAEVLPPGVVVRQGPSSTAPMVGELPGGSGVEVRVTQRGADGHWVQVALPDGRVGFVPEASLRRTAMPPRWRSADPGRSQAGSTNRSVDGAVEVPLRRVGGVLLVESRVNGHVATHFILDTGASVVTINHVLAGRLGLDYSGSPMLRLTTPSGIMHSPRVVLDVVHVPDEAGARVTGVEAVVATLPGSPPEIGGLLGQSFLRHFNVTIHSDRGMLRLQPVSAGDGRNP